MSAALETHPLAALPGARFGFLGTGWIGAQRLKSLSDAGLIAQAVLCEPDAASRGRALEACGGEAELRDCLEGVLESGVDGLVIATPSGQHARQARAALQHGVAVFCQKPLACSAAETGEVLAAARTADRLLEVDFCYRTLAAAGRLRELVHSGELGEVHAAELVFHNAYGPDKPWFYDLAQSGGGCLMDLGSHLVDLLLWVVGAQPIERISGRLHAKGRRLARPVGELEDFALAEIELAGVSARLACSWRLPAGCDAVISATFYGTRGAAVLHNCNGSFHDFALELCLGTATRTLVRPPDDWGGRAVCAWARRVAAGERFDAQEAQRLGEVAAVLDAVYGR